MCSPELVALATWRLQVALSSNAAFNPVLMDLWYKIDPYTERDAGGDHFDAEGNALTAALVPQDGPDLTKMCQTLRTLGVFNARTSDS